MKRTVNYYFELDKEKGQKILVSLQARGRVSYSAAYKWMKGERKPLPLYQDLIQRLIKEHYGITVPKTELFGI